MPMNNDLQNIISNTPRILTRHDLCLASRDPKLDERTAPVYVPQIDYDHAKSTLSNPDQLIMLEEGFSAEPFYDEAALHGLLYLPHPYLVPGGRFNEMYGWDTAFPVFAWADTHPQLMREQVDNLLYQVKAYGKVLNANRTYYLSRSQPPLLSAMIMHIWDEAQKHPWSDFDREGLYHDAFSWLEHAYLYTRVYHQYWTTGDRLAGDTGLSRYWDDGDLPAPEVLSGEEGHFHHARDFYRHNAISTDDQEDAALFYRAEDDQLTPFYHRANRAMRASGFDPTGHWGYGALRCIFHAPACLNSLLYKMENDLSHMAAILHKHNDEREWLDLQTKRKTRMKEFLFSPLTGAYLDYDFERKRLNTKPYATLFYPLWAGLYDDEADKDALSQLVEHALQQLETPHGIVTSNEVSGSQWDYPYGWPPLHYFAFEGLKRYGYHEDAQRVAQKYVSLLENVISSHGQLYEKYNVIDGNAEIHVVNGYDINVNERGTFLWTAAVATLALKLITTSEK